jgi:[ribosomal protein S5]-alanine N-acetyltransferase
MNPPPYPIFPFIIGNKILLRQIIPKDIKDLIEISFYDAIQAKTELNATSMQDQIYKDYLDGNSIHWGIIDKLTHKIVGTCGYYRGFDQSEGELGCVLLPQFRGQGYMFAALLLAIEFGLNTIKLKRIWATTSQSNKAVIQLLERLNFIKVADLDGHEIKYELETRNK